jgi:hypothetical protein
MAAKPGGSIMGRSLPVLLFVAAALVAGPAAAAPAGGIREFQVLSTAPAYGGATPTGAAGPYEVITGTVHGELDPAAPANAGIADLKLAPVGPDGMVAYSTDVVILRPVRAADARRVLFYDVVNRGRKLAIRAFIGSDGLAGGPPPATFPSLLRLGATIVWSGWQGDLPQTGTPAIAANAGIGTQFPIARQQDGQPMTGMSREEYIPDSAGYYAGGASNTIELSYPPADASDRASVIFTARQSWQTRYGAADPGPASYDAPSVPVTDWHYAMGPAGEATVVFSPPAQVSGPGGKPVASDAGTIYSFVYRARDPRVNGIGFAAVRDLVSFLRHDADDAFGHANPLDDLKAAACATASCPSQPATNFDVAIGEGISQSGRFLRDFLYLGFNADGAGREVFDGMMPIIAGARRTWVNERFSQPGRWSKQHEDHWQPGDQFPFTYATITDPIGGRTDGLLAGCTANGTCPRVMQIDGEFEWWGARASLVVNDGKGNDLGLPASVRYYLVSGTMHGGGDGVTSGLVNLPAPESQCQLPTSPVAEAPVWRALVPALIDWVARDTVPPPSQYPTVASGTAVRQDATGFPDLGDAVVPSGGRPSPLHLASSGIVNPIAVTRYEHALPVADQRRAYALLVPKVDGAGNATSGILVPDLKVPLATYTGWNPRGEGHAVGEGCFLYGGTIPFAVDGAAKAGGHDSRPTLADLYHGRADYQGKVAAAATALVHDGYLLQADANNLFDAHARAVSPLLIPAP